MSILEKASLVLIPSGYKEDVLYSQVPNTSAGDFTFTRASTGTRVNADGYVEEVPWNISTYSEDFTNASYVKNNCTVTANQTNSPINTTTADQIDFGSGSGFFYNNATDITRPCTYSVYVKYIDYQFIQIIGTGDVEHYANFDVQNGTVGNTGSQSTASIEDAGNGWYRCIINYNDGTFTGGVRLYKATSLTAGWAGGGGVAGSFYFWGNQLVNGTSPKNYIQTTDRLDIPRLDYSGEASCPTLKVEGQRTNLITYSEDFSQWATLGADVIEYVSDLQNPDGLTGGYKVKGSGIYLTSSLSGTTQRSIYARSVSGSGDVQLMTHNSNTNNVFTLNEEWQRFDLDSITSSTGETSFYIDLRGASSTLSELYVWGAMAETGNFPTSYLPTRGTSVTRTVDSFEVDNLSTIIGQTEGCIFIEFVYYEGNRFYIYDNGSTADGFLIYRSGTTYNLQVGNGGTYWAITNFITGLTVGESYKLAINYKLNDYKVYVNGSQEATSTSIEVPTMNKIISSQLGGANKFTNDIKSFALFNETLTNDELVVLTGGTVIDTYNWIDSDLNEMITSDGDNLIFT